MLSSITTMPIFYKTPILYHYDYAPLKRCEHISYLSVMRICIIRMLYVLLFNKDIILECSYPDLFCLLFCLGKQSKVTKGLYTPK